MFLQFFSELALFSYKSEVLADRLVFFSHPAHFFLDGLLRVKFIYSYNRLSFSGHMTWINNKFT